MMPNLLLLLASLASAATPAADARPGLETLAAVPDTEWTTARAEALTAIDDAALEALSSDADWRVGLTAQALTAWRTRPEEAEATWDSAPVRRRDGALVFRGDGLPEVIGERLQHGVEPVATRLALVDWLRRSTSTWPKWADSAWRDESEAAVRAAWIDAARYLRSTSRVDGEDGREVVLRGFDDADAAVRAASARIAAYLDAPRLVPALKQATSDPSDEVAGLAARSLGLLRAGGAYETVAAVLGREDPRARLYAVRALQRLDGARAKSDARIDALSSDPDPKVARAAADVTGS